MLFGDCWKLPLDNKSRTILSKAVQVVQLPQVIMSFLSLLFLVFFAPFLLLLGTKARRTSMTAADSSKHI